MKRGYNIILTNMFSVPGKEDLLALADLVEQITIHRGTPVSVMRDILSRKCICLVIYTVLSLSDAEDIIQVR